MYTGVCVCVHFITAQHSRPSSAQAQRPVTCRMSHIFRERRFAFSKHTGGDERKYIQADDCEGNAKHNSDTPAETKQTSCNNSIQTFREPGRAQ